MNYFEINCYYCIKAHYHRLIFYFYSEKNATNKSLIYLDVFLAPSVA